MITLTRRQARTLRGVFRRSILGIAHRGPIPPLVLTAADGQLRARHRYAHLVVEHAVASAWPSSWKPISSRWRKKNAAGAGSCR